MEAWPLSLRTTVNLVLGSPVATILLWGPTHIQIYNDHWRVLMGNKHPAALGQPTHECFPEIADVMAPLYERVQRGEAVILQDMLLPIRRDSGVKDAWWNVHYLPVRNESGVVAGIFCTVIETTTGVLAAQELAAAVAALRASEERQAFLLKLTDALRPLDAATEIKAMATRLLGEQLGVNRTFYADAENGNWLVTKGYEQGVELLPETPFPMTKYGQWIIDDFRNGRRLVVNDMAPTLGSTRLERSAHQILQIGAEAAVPLVKNGKLVAMLVVHVVTPRDWTETELALVDETAERTWAAVERARAEAALRESEARLAVELADTRELHRISSSLIAEDNVDAIYDEILEAARLLMRSEMASIQKLVPERQELFLLSQHGFAPESAKFWQWVRADDTTSCGVALARGEPVIIPDVETWDFVAGTEDLRHYRPLPSARCCPCRSPRATAAWSGSCRPTGARFMSRPRELRLLDVLARQAADLIERRAGIEALRRSEEKYRSLFQTMGQGYAECEMVRDDEGRALDHRLLDLNPAFERLTGVSADAARGRLARELFPAWSASGPRRSIESSSEAYRSGSSMKPPPSAAGTRPTYIRGTATASPSSTRTSPTASARRSRCARPRSGFGNLPMPRRTCCGSATPGQRRWNT